MCAPSVPTPPDPTTVAQAQGQENRQTAVANANLNRVNTQTPYGNLTYTTTGTNPDGTPQYNAAVTLSPQEQTLFDINTANQGALAQTAQGMLGQVQGAYGTPIDVSGAPGIASSVNNRGPALAAQISNSGMSPLVSNVNTSGFPGVASSVQQNGATTADAIKNAQDAAYKSQTQYLDPQYAQAEDQLRTRLANQGTVQGSDAYNNAINNQALEKQRAYQSAQNAATLAGQQEQATLYGQGLAGAQLQNAANQQQFGQGVTQADLANAVNQQQFGQNAAQAGFQNSANQQGFGQGATNASLQNTANQQYLANLFALRNQPLNEFNALTTGAQVQNPAFPNVPGTQQANTNVAGIYQQNFQNQLQNAQLQNAFTNNLFSLGGALGGAALGNWSDIFG